MTLSVVQRALAVEKHRRDHNLPGVRELVDSGESQGKRWNVYETQLPGGWKLTVTITHWRDWRETIVTPSGERSGVCTRTNAVVVDSDGVIRDEEEL